MFLGKQNELFPSGPVIQGRIQDFFKEGVISMRVQGKRPRAKGTEEGEGEGEGGLMFEYVDFLHFDFRGINFFKFETLLIRTKSTDR